MNTKWIGSKLKVKEEKLNCIVQQLITHTLDTINESTSFIDIHNAYTAYSVMLLFSSTGHRPVVDPFCFIRDFDFNLSMLNINDKDISEQHANRVVALPSLAIEQINFYLEHLKWLSSKIMVEHPSLHLDSAIQDVMDSSISKSEQQLPLFFFLKEELNSVKSISVREETLQSQLQSLWPLPFNQSRHFIA